MNHLYPPTSVRGKMQTSMAPLARRSDPRPRSDKQHGDLGRRTRGHEQCNTRRVEAQLFGRSRRGRASHASTVKHFFRQRQGLAHFARHRYPLAQTRTGTENGGVNVRRLLGSPLVPAIVAVAAGLSIGWATAQVRLSEPRCSDPLVAPRPPAPGARRPGDG